MKPTLTTVTPYWGRPDMLRVWLKAIQGATFSSVRHVVLFVGDRNPGDGQDYGCEFVALPDHKPGEMSIAYYHQLGFYTADSEWVMKLDVDCLPNVRFFPELLRILSHAQQREWFNVGAFHVKHLPSASLLKEYVMPLATRAYESLVLDRHQAFTSAFPIDTNFVCRRQDYFDCGISADKFRGFGWEDYAQIYALEKQFLGRDPLPGTVTLENVTQRCRDELSRPKAKQLFERCSYLALLHKWHPKNTDPLYRSHMEANRKLLYSIIR